MTDVTLADAKARLSELVNLVARGEAVTITRRGKAVARLTPVERPRAPIDVISLKAVTDTMPASPTDTVREMRDDARY